MRVAKTRSNMTLLDEKNIDYCNNYFLTEGKNSIVVGTIFLPGRRGIGGIFITINIFIIRGCIADNTLHTYLVDWMDMKFLY